MGSPWRRKELMKNLRDILINFGTVGMLSLILTAQLTKAMSPPLKIRGNVVPVLLLLVELSLKPVSRKKSEFLATTLNNNILTAVLDRMGQMVAMVLPLMPTSSGLLTTG